MRRHILALLVICLAAHVAWAQDRDTKVRNDRQVFGASRDWIYNDLKEGVRVATQSGKPLFVVFRCIPCEACQEFDDDVARRDPIIRDLLDEFVRVRIVQANTIDLTKFQHDFDLSFAAYFLNPDMTIYGRFGTRSERPEQQDISLQGLRRAMEGALRLHRDYGAVKDSLAGKQVTQARYRTPRDYPSLASGFGEKIDYEGKTAKSCMHCHQVREAERLVFRSANQPIPDAVLFPFPDPAVLGLKLDPKEMAKIEKVEPETIAARAGLRAGDEIVSLNGQPLLSIADVQWVLHNAPASTSLQSQLKRAGQPMSVTLDLPEGWRRGNISWRTTTWDLRRMGLGGLQLEELSKERRADLKLGETSMALQVRHAGEYGEHAVAKRAGFQKGDIIVSFDGSANRMTESALLAHALQTKRPGDKVTIDVLRDGVRRALTIALQ